MAQLVEQLLRTTEIRGSNPVIGKFYLPIVQFKKMEKMKIKKKEAWNDPYVKKVYETVI